MLVPPAELAAFVAAGRLIKRHEERPAAEQSWKGSSGTGRSRCRRVSGDYSAGLAVSPHLLITQTAADSSEAMSMTAR